MADWYFASNAVYVAAPWAMSDGRSPATAWSKGTNHSDARAVKLASIEAGDTLWILDDHNGGLVDGLLQGTYPEGVTIRGDYPGRPGRLSVVGLNSVVNMSVLNLTVSGGSFGITNVNGLLVDGLEVSHQQKGWTTAQNSNADNVTIRNCVFRHLTHEGIECFVRTGFTRDNWLIENNLIYGVGYDPSVINADCEGIGLQRVTNIVIQRNIIFDCRYGINLWESGNGITHDVTIKDNLVYNIYGGPQSWPSRGIMMSGGSSVEGSIYNILIEDNCVYSTGREGIRLQAPAGASGLVATNNVVMDTNKEFGTPDSEFIVAPAAWQLSRNRFYPIYRSYNRSSTRSWSL